MKSINDMCLAGVNVDTGIVEAAIGVRSPLLKQYIEDKELKYYWIIADKELTREALGKKIDSPIDLIRRA